jgi:hypothetical protein
VVEFLSGKRQQTNYSLLLISVLCHLSSVLWSLALAYD